ncbi:MAG: hypothetical protein SPL22_00775 [Treponema sp.]|uniref:hypothetical protein n=1 Tax=Treponema sp. TaxID=166 RepID=UPI002A90D114|nr:hypothetical protein [Treponema sp.]MDY6396238.1 hypothetical protein [Treponema sp.]
MINNKIAQQREFQKEIENTEIKITELTNKLKSFDDEKKLEKILLLLEKNEYSQKLENIESALNGIDLDYLRNLNSKIDKLLKKQKRSVYFIICFVILGIFAFIWLCPLSSVFQETRQKKLLNDILEQHYDQLVEDDDAVKVLEECKKLLEEWKTNRQPK